MTLSQMSRNAAAILLILYLRLIQPSGSSLWSKVGNDISLERFHLPAEVEEVFHGEHASDLLDTLDERVARATFFFLYRKECESDLDILQSDLRLFIPDSPFVALLRHNYAAYYHMIWFNKSSGNYNVKEAYKLDDSQCSCIVPIKRGNKGIFDYTCRKVPDTNAQLIRYVWNEIEFEMTIHNALDKHTRVVIAGKGPKLASLYLQPNSSASTKIYPSYDVLAYTLEEDDFVGGWLVNSSRNTLIKITHITQEAESQWKTRTNIETRKLADHLSRLAEDHARRHLGLLVQPALVKHFHNTGYLKKRIPHFVYNALTTLFEENQDKIKTDNMPPHFSVWNGDEVDTLRIDIKDGTAKLFHDYLMPMAERFCDCKLKSNMEDEAITRLRIYTTGNKIRMHTDEVSSGNIIGIILHYTRDLGGAGNWPFQLIDHNGNQQVIMMNPGDLVVFESSSLPHGRPTYFRGRYFVNTFLYYTPMAGWEPAPLEAEVPLQVKTEL